jgi:hypothetical protein
LAVTFSENFTVSINSINYFFFLFPAGLRFGDGAPLPFAADAAMPMFGDKSLLP